MRIRHIVRDRIEVECPGDPKHRAVYKEAFMTLMDFGSLHIRENSGPSPASALYAKAQLIEMRPNFMHLKACWWESILGEDPTEENTMMLPVDIRAMFDF
jgi:hypothetical protein